MGSTDQLDIRIQPQGLRRCPFCGERGARMETFDEFDEVEFMVCCDSCLAVGPTGTTPAAARTKWSARVAPNEDIPTHPVRQSRPTYLYSFDRKRHIRDDSAGDEVALCGASGGYRAGGVRECTECIAAWSHIGEDRKPCPFCGSTDIDELTEDPFKVVFVCRGCFAMVGDYTYETTRSRWNTRLNTEPELGDNGQRPRPLIPDEDLPF